MTNTSTTPAGVHDCLVCPVRGREKPNQYEHRWVCNSCRRWLDALPGDILSLWLRLGQEHFADDTRSYDVRVPFIGPLTEAETDKAAETITRGAQRAARGRPTVPTGERAYNDPVAAQLPTEAPGRTPPRLGLVSGSREPQAPINLDVVDLALPASAGNLTPQGKAEWRHQIGHLSVATELDQIARRWAAHLGHRLPPPTGPALAEWLRIRMPEACDTMPDIDNTAAQLSKLRGTLRSILGETPARPQRMQAPCPGCDMFTLVRRPGEDVVECQGPDEDCRRVLRLDEYEDWARRVLAYEREHPHNTEELAA